MPVWVAVALTIAAPTPAMAVLMAVLAARAHCPRAPVPRARTGGNDAACRGRSEKGEDEDDSEATSAGEERDHAPKGR